MISGVFKRKRSLRRRKCFFLVGICQVVAVPCQQIIHFVVRRNGDMQGIADNLGRHEVVCNVNLGNISDIIVDFQKVQFSHNGQLLSFQRVVSALQFVDRGDGSMASKETTTLNPPIPSPMLSGKGFRITPGLVIK